MWDSLRRLTEEFARTRNPSCRVPCRGVLAGKKVPSLYTSSSDPQKRNTPQEKTVKFGSFDDAAGHEKNTLHLI